MHIRNKRNGRLVTASFHHYMIMAHFPYVVTGHWITQLAKYQIGTGPSLALLLLLINTEFRLIILVWVLSERQLLIHSYLYYHLKYNSRQLHLYTWYQFLLNQILLEGYGNVVQFLCHSDGHRSSAENMIQIFQVLYHYNRDAWSGQLKWVDVGKLHDTKPGVQGISTFPGLTWHIILNALFCRMVSLRKSISRVPYLVAIR